MTGIKLADKQPSALLRELRVLAGSNVPDDVVNAMDATALSAIQKVLAVEGIQLNKLIKLVDKTLER